MNKFYGALFAFAVIMIVFSADISRFVGDMMTVTVAGIILSLFAGTAFLLETYKK